MMYAAYPPVREVCFVLATLLHGVACQPQPSCSPHECEFVPNRNTGLLRGLKMEHTSCTIPVRRPTTRMSITACKAVNYRVVLTQLVTF